MRAFRWGLTQQTDEERSTEFEFFWASVRNSFSACVQAISKFGIPQMSENTLLKSYFFTGCYGTLILRPFNAIPLAPYMHFTLSLKCCCSTSAVSSTHMWPTLPSFAHWFLRPVRSSWNPASVKFAQFEPARSVKLWETVVHVPPLTRKSYLNLLEQRVFRLVDPSQRCLSLKWIYRLCSIFQRRASKRIGNIVYVIYVSTFANRKYHLQCIRVVKVVVEA